MKTLWSRLTLECYQHPDDTDPIPWYAWPLALVFIAGWLMSDFILTVTGF